MFATVDGVEINIRYNEVDDCYVMDRYDFDCTEIGEYDCDLFIEEEDEIIQSGYIDIIALTRRCIYFLPGEDEEDDESEQPYSEVFSYSSGGEYSESLLEEES